MAYVIFDLDHTVIDSTHRQLTLPDGSLDLAHWLENCTREKIMRDTLLPLANIMRQYYAAGHTVIVCTARSGHCNDDREFLAMHNLPYHHWLSRGDSQEPDAALKVRLLTELAVSLGYPSLAHMGAIMFDDNQKVIAAMCRNRVICLDAVSYNRNLARGKGIPSRIAAALAA